MGDHGGIASYTAACWKLFVLSMHFSYNKVFYDILQYQASDAERCFRFLWVSRIPASFFLFCTKHTCSWDTHWGQVYMDILQNSSKSSDPLTFCTWHATCHLLQDFIHVFCRFCALPYLGSDLRVVIGVYRHVWCQCLTQGLGPVRSCKLSGNWFGAGAAFGSPSQAPVQPDEKFHLNFCSKPTEIKSPLKPSFWF